jgi:prolyl-tRNA synthetase
MQDNLLNRALAFREANTVKIDTKEEFYKFFEGENCGFALAHWNGSAEVEEKIKADLKVTIRCIPFGDKEPGECIITGEPSAQRVYFAKSY